MKTLKSFINEAIQIEKGKYNGYRVISLVRREDIDCSKISEEEFIKFMTADLKEAAQLYYDKNKVEKDEEDKKYIERETERIKKYAESKYKREHYKQKYIETAIKNIKTNPFERKLEYLDFKVEPWKNSIYQDCILEPYKITDEKLASCFKLIKDNKYFKKATGWALKYHAGENTWRSSFRPYIDLIVDDNTKAEMEKDEESLAKAISAFYSGSNYWGD